MAYPALLTRKIMGLAPKRNMVPTSCAVICMQQGGNMAIEHFILVTNINLNGISSIVDKEDDGVGTKSHHGAHILSGHLQSA